MQPTRLSKRESIAEGTHLFRFTKPEGFTHAAGQSVDLTLIDPPETDADGNSRTFSILSAPHEAELVVATRMRDTAFKRVLASMPLGSVVLLDGPFGSFTLHENVARPAVFLAGGIGITPFYSMLTDALARNLLHEIRLFYSNHRAEDTPLLGELAALAVEHARFTFVPTMTSDDVSTSSWAGARGRIDAAMLMAHVPAGSSPVYYIAGPQPFVTAMRAVLKESGVSNDDLRFEEFAGY